MFIYSVGTETFIGDPNVPEAVTGSPFGTNFVRIEGPNSLRAETNLFAVSGKLSDVPLPTPIKVERATYSRDSTGNTVQQDFFVMAPPAPATVRYIDVLGFTGDMQDNGSGSWFGWSSQPGVTPNGNVSFTVDNKVAVPSSLLTTQSCPLVDLVTISSAKYSVSTQILTVNASSSDLSGQPVLFAVDPVTLQDFGNLAEGKLILENLVSPPATVVVYSAYGGSDTEKVELLP